MDKETLLSLLRPYGVGSLATWREIDSTCEGDYRLNVIVDRRYVLRINDPIMTEERLAAIDRLAGRYCAIGVAAPRLVSCAETNDGISDADFAAYPVRQLYTQWCARQAEQLRIILQEYSLNELEKAALPDYRAIARISQYPNACSYHRFLHQDAAKAARLIELVISQ